MKIDPKVDDLFTRTARLEAEQSNDLCYPSLAPTHDELAKKHRYDGAHGQEWPNRDGVLSIHSLRYYERAGDYDADYKGQQ